MTSDTLPHSARILVYGFRLAGYGDGSLDGSGGGAAVESGAPAVIGPGSVIVGGPGDTAVARISVPKFTCRPVSVPSTS